LELEIEDININLTGDGWDEREVAREVQRYLIDAMEELSKYDLMTGGKADEILVLDLPEIEWESAADKTAELVHIIKDAIEDSE
jgi:hypothetical protein